MVGREEEMGGRASATIPASDRSLAGHGAAYRRPGGARLTEIKARRGSDVV
jgi:hypothetical protein